MTDDELNRIYVVARITAENDSIYEEYNYISHDECYDLDDFAHDFYGWQDDRWWAQRVAERDDRFPKGHAEQAVDILTALEAL